MPSNITAEIRAYSKHWNTRGYIYWGEIYGDAKNRWPDGRTFHTSRVVKEEDMGDHIIATTYNSVYKLMKNQSLEALIGSRSNKWRGLQQSS